MANNIVLVTWHDARFYGSTRKPEEIERLKVARFESVGYLVSQDEVATVISAERNEEGEYRDITLIPTGTVISITSLMVEVPDD